MCIRDRNAIAGLIKMAEHAIDDPDKLQDCLHKMNLSSDHLLTLVNDILDFSKIESGKMELVKESFSFKELVQAICSMVNTQAKEKGVFFATEAYGLNKESLVGDTLRLKQVLLNLLSLSLIHIFSNLETINFFFPCSRILFFKCLWAGCFLGNKRYCLIGLSGVK